MINGRFAEIAFPGRWSLFFTVRDPTAVRAIWAVGVLALAMWTLGLFTRVSSIVGMVVWISLNGRNPLLFAFPDQLALMLGFLVALMPAGRGFSLDARWRGLGGPVPVWCRRVIQLQLAILYTASGLEKTGETWHEDGTAIYYTVLNPYNRHFLWGSLAARLQPWLFKPATFVVLYWETWFWLFLVYHWVFEAVGRRLPAWGARRRAGEPGWRLPDLRWPMLGFGALMHLGIQAAVYVMYFSPLTVAAYTCFFTSEDLRAAVARVRGWLSRRTARA
nr:HTTM domain-containing protein [Pseudenhygromyxa sp. WMMC2535]